jgi:serine protease Do
MKSPNLRKWIVFSVLGLAVGGFLWQQSHTAAQQPQLGAAKPAGIDDAPPAARKHASELSKAFRGAANAILPSVVTIEVTTKAKPAKQHPGMQGGENPFKGTPFEDFFNDEQLKQFGGGGGMQRGTPRQEGAGTGVIIDKSGVILTNNHVVNGADVITVRLADGREFKGSDVKTDPQTDLAIVRIEGGGNLPAAKLGNSDEMEIGDWVLAVGNPFGLEQTVSAGIISGKGRQIGAAQRAQFLQTDAAINPGNSGGPLVNLEGEVIGINTAIASNGGGNDGIGFAVPVNLAKWVAPQLMVGGKVQRAYLGVAIAPVDNTLAQKFGVERNGGVLVTEIFPNSPAGEAGIKEGDVILDFAGVAVHNPRELQEVVERAELNSKQPARILRDGKPLTINIVAKALPSNFGRAAAGGNSDEPQGEPAKPSNFEHEKLGLEVTDLSEAQAKQMGFEGYTGVLVASVKPDSPAFEAGLREGMLIRRVGRDDVSDVAAFRKLVDSQNLDEGLLLMVRTQQGNRYVVIGGK